MMNVTMMMTNLFIREEILYRKKSYYLITTCAMYDFKEERKKGERLQGKGENGILIDLVELFLIFVGVF